MSLFLALLALLSSGATALVRSSGHAAEGGALSVPAGAATLTPSTKVLVTGAAGYIGSHAVLALLDKGIRVIGVDDLSRGHPETVQTLKLVAVGSDQAGMESHGQSELFKFYAMDVGNEAGFSRILEAEKPDAVMHFAGVAYAGESAEDPLRYYHNNTVNTMNVAESMMKHGIKHLIFSSSCSTYGSPTQMPVTEETRQKPVSPYGWSKLHAERVLRDFTASPNASKAPFKVALLRYFNVIGADPKGRVGERHPRDLVPGSKAYQQRVRISTALFDAAQGKSSMFNIAGEKYDTPDGTALRDYVHVVDLVDAHIATLESIMGDTTLPALRYYNVGTGTPYSVKDMVRAVEAVTRVNFTVRVGDARATDPPKVWADNSKIKREVGWQPKYLNLTETMKHAWDFRCSDTMNLVQEDDSAGMWQGEAYLNDESEMTPLTLQSLYHQENQNQKRGMLIDNAGHVVTQEAPVKDASLDEQTHRSAEILVSTDSSTAASCSAGLRSMMQDLQKRGLQVPTDGNPLGGIEGGSNDQEVDYLAQLAKAELVRLSKPEGSGTICQTGFNFGNSAFAFLCGTSAKVFSWDLGAHEYIKPADEMIQKLFPGRHTLTLGDSTKTLPLAAKGMASRTNVQCDVVFVDGGHTKDVARADIANFAELVSPGTMLIVDDCEEKAKRKLADTKNTPWYVAGVDAAFEAGESSGLVREEDYEKESGLKQHTTSRSVCVARYAPKPSTTPGVFSRMVAFVGRLFW